MVIEDMVSVELCIKVADAVFVKLAFGDYQM
jgi:hypothetical protein